METRHREADARELEDEVRSSLMPEELTSDLEKMMLGLGKSLVQRSSGCLVV